MSPLRFQ